MSHTSMHTLVVRWLYQNLIPFMSHVSIEPTQTMRLWANLIKEDFYVGYEFIYELVPTLTVFLLRNEETERTKGEKLPNGRAGSERDIIKFLFLYGILFYGILRGKWLTRYPKNYPTSPARVSIHVKNSCRQVISLA